MTLWFVRVMVFDRGELKECGRPADLLRDPDSMFADMARHAPGLKSAAATNSDEDSATSSSGLGGSTDVHCTDDIVQIG